MTRLDGAINKLTLKVNSQPDPEILFDVSNLIEIKAHVGLAETSELLDPQQIIDPTVFW